MHLGIRTICILIFCAAFVAKAVDGINKVPLVISDSTNYSFILSAHFYGGDKNVNGYPASSILGSIDLLNDQDNSFTVCLGDLFRDIKNQRELYDRVFIGKIKTPLFNAVGNHDVTDDIFSKNYGPTFFKFQIHKDVHVILNTELDDGSIKNEQLSLLKEALKSPDAENVFIYAHRPVWAEAEDQFDGVFRGNTVSNFGVNYLSDVKPLMEQSGKQVYWCSGSLGGSAPASFFYHNQNNLHYIQSAIRDLKRDAVLKVTSKDGVISFQTISLTGEDLLTLQEYNLDKWRESHPVESFNYRLVPLYFKNMVFHRYFWYGIFWFSGLLIFIWLFKKWRKKRKSA